MIRSILKFFFFFNAFSIFILRHKKENTDLHNCYTKRGYNAALILVINQLSIIFTSKRTILMKIRWVQNRVISQYSI